MSKFQSQIQFQQICQKKNYLVCTTQHYLLQFSTTNSTYKTFCKVYNKLDIRIQDIFVSLTPETKLTYLYNHLYEMTY